MPKSLLRALGLALAALASASAFAQVVVGAPFALTGSVGALANEMRKGAELAMHQVNEQGGLLGSPYALAFADTACDAEQAVRAVQRLLDDPKTVALIGPVCSGATLRQARSVAIPAGVVTLSVASASSLISRLNDNDLVFRTAPSDALKGRAMARVAYDQGIREIAVSHASDAYNTGIAEVFAEAFKASGGRISVMQTHQPGQRDYRGEAGAAARASSDVAVFAYYGSGGVEYLQALAESGRVQRVIGTDGLMAKTLDKAVPAGLLSQLTIVTAAADRSRPAYRLWEGFARDRAIKADGPYVANAYDAAFMMALAIEAAGSADRGRIAAALRSVAGPPGVKILPGEFAKAKALLASGQDIDYDGASGPVDFDEVGDIVGRLSVNRFLHGSWQETLLD
ncbi:MAG: ABC transporter substrate-binding protein [Burkholderiaceae bacterium]